MECEEKDKMYLKNTLEHTDLLLAARDLLYAISHRQDSTYHSLW